jgi:hypothetical protein
MLKIESVVLPYDLLKEVGKFEVSVHEYDLQHGLEAYSRMLQARSRYLKRFEKFS